MDKDAVKLNKAKGAAEVEPVLTSTEIKAVKQLISIFNTGALSQGINCEDAQGCCYDKGCCHDLPGCTHDNDFGMASCMGDIEGKDFLNKIGDHQAVIGSYILANKESVLAYFKSQGVKLQL